MGVPSLPVPGKMPPSSEEDDLSDSCYSDNLDLSTSVKSVNNEHVNVLINKVLAFTWSIMQRYAIDDTAQQIVKSFKLDDIVNAKATLWSHCRGDLEIIGRRKKRRDSVARSGALAHAKDIASALQKLDMKKKTPAIVIVASDLPSLPTCAVKASNGDIEYRMSKLESVCNGLQETLMNLCKTVAEQQSNFAIRMDGLVALCQNFQQASNELSMLSDETQKKKQQGSSLEVGSDPQTKSKVMAPSREEPSRPTMSEMAQQLQNSEAPFKEVKRSRRPPSKKKRSQQGSGTTSDALRSGRQLFKLLVTNLHSSATQYISQKNEGIVLKDVADKSAEGWDNK